MGLLPWGSFRPTRAPAPPTPEQRAAEWARQCEERERGAALVGVYWQVSRRCRTVARLPEGRTGVAALAEAARACGQRDAAAWARALGERGAGDQFLRVYASAELRRTLTVDEFAGFREAGGGTYSGRG